MHPAHPSGFALENGSPGDKVPVLRCGVITLSDIHAEPDKRFIGNLEKLWFVPELRRRQADGRPYIAEGNVLLLSRALVVLPPDAEARVFFNKEVQLQFDSLPRYPSAMELTPPGAPLTAQDFEDIISASLPQVTAQDGFLLFAYGSGTHYAAFDFLPCGPRGAHDESPDPARQAIMRGLAAVFAEDMFGACFEQPEAIREAMLKDGWWPAMCLLPDVYLAIAAAYARSEPQAAIETVLAFLTSERLKVMVENWWSLAEFSKHKQLIEEGLSCYTQRLYGAAFSTLAPCLEGIITRRLKAKGEAAPKHRGIPDAIARLGAVPSYLPEKACAEFTEYVRQHFYQRFDWNWAESDVEEAEGRHAVAHGAKLVYDAADAVQVIVALDSLYRIIRPPNPYQLKG